MCFNHHTSRQVKVAEARGTCTRPFYFTITLILLAFVITIRSGRRSTDIAISHGLKFLNPAFVRPGSHYDPRLERLDFV